jgi:hypothetical protein
MFLTETAVPVKKGCWSAGSEKDEVSFKAFLVDDRSAFERGEDGAFGLREPKAGFDERVDHERGIDGNQELFKAGAPGSFCSGLRDDSQPLSFGIVTHLTRCVEDHGCACVSGIRGPRRKTAVIGVSCACKTDPSRAHLFV